MTDLFDELRIIAGEGRLSGADGRVLTSAADEFEATQRALAHAQCLTIELQAKLIAVNDRLIDVTGERNGLTARVAQTEEALRVALAASCRRAIPDPLLRMCSGWIAVNVRESEMRT